MLAFSYQCLCSHVIYHTRMLFLLLHDSDSHLMFLSVVIVVFFLDIFAPHLSAGLCVNGVHPLAHSFIFDHFPALTIFQQKYLLVSTVVSVA